MPAIAKALTGIAAGVWLTSARSKMEKVRGLVVAGTVSTLLGLLWSLEFPINKNLWTSSYVLFTSGLAAIALGWSHAVLDRDPPPRWTRPWVVLGTNALVLFVVSGWRVKTLLWLHLPAPDGTDTTAYRSIYLHAFAPFAPAKVTSLLVAPAALLLLYGCSRPCTDAGGF
ncbi:MAG TPA: hypothetical protein VFO19_23835 [Vicinamibacterales bacterium]|nr:hypothetical protein [Vicinamibacterales bacterium]